VELIVGFRESRRPGTQEVEVVERKGLGHPDSICDAIAEQICVRLCRHYRDRFGHVLHHNVDKVLLVGGRSRASFGGGTVLEPIEIYLAGRATQEYRNEVIAIDEIAVDACRDWLRTHLHGLNVDRDVRIIPRLRPGSTELQDVFTRGRAVPLANDTACGVGFAPLTDLERVVLEVERQLNAPETRQVHPEIGADIKVMGTRRGRRIDMTISCAFVGRFIADVHAYARAKDAALALALDTARRTTKHDVQAVINAADDVGNERIFLTVTGTSAEAGDDGEAGRGNRVSGLITPYRPMTIESIAGKNPVSHPGKLYNLLANRITETITEDIPRITDAECVLVSEIGRVLSDPRVVDVRLWADDSGHEPPGRVAGIVRSELERIPDLRDAVLNDRVGAS
jgi:S-adenosylmethionine synthetase